MTTTRAQLCLDQPQQQQQLQQQHITPQRLKCGEVYSWDCAGEMYGVECALCEERPLCTLAEFAEHMDIWHSSWSEEEPVEQLDYENAGAQPIVSSEQRKMEQLEANDSAALASSEKVGVAAGEDDDDVEKEADDDDIEKEVEDDDDVEKEAEDDDVEKEADDDDIEKEVEDDDDVEKEAEDDDVEKEAENDDIEKESEDDNIEKEAEDDDIEKEAEDVDVFSLDSLEPFEQVLIADDTVSTTTAFLEANTENVILSAEEPSLAEARRTLEEHKEPCSTAKYSLQDAVTEEVIMQNTTTKKVDNEMDWPGNVANTDSVDDLHKPDIAMDDLTDSLQCSNEDSNTWCTSESDSEELLVGEANSELSKVKLCRNEMEKLIELYRSHVRLWQQKHPEFNDTHLCRKSWQQLTQTWNEYCQKSFTRTDVRIRMSTLCQRYLKERARPSGDVNFTYYEQLQFLDEQQTLIDRRQFLEQQNEKLLAIYADFPVLWHRERKHLKLPTERKAAYHKIGVALKQFGIHMPRIAIQRRLQSLRKYYNSEKMRRLQCQRDGSTFEPNFRLYQQMQFLDEHIDPFVCAICGKFYKTLFDYRVHERREHNGEEDEEMANINGNQTEIGGVAETEGASAAVKSAVIETADRVEAFTELEDVTDECLVSTSSPAVVASTADEVDNAVVQESTTAEKNESRKAASMEIEPATVAGEDNADRNANDSDSAAENGENTTNNAETFARLTVEQTHKLIALYQNYPQLWDPRDLDYQCRNVRRIAWRMLTERLNQIYSTCYTWTTLHRKLTDYLKYYKREKQRIETERSCTKWCFYEDFTFMDAVLELQNTTLTREHNEKIIELYRAYPQLWDTLNPQFTKRRTRHQHIVAICARLKTDCQIRITPDKLKHRIIEFRCNYRTAKAQRLAALKRNEPWTPKYEFYDVLKFLDLHVAPFVCAVCGAQYKRHTDFLQHERKQHAPSAKGNRRNAAKDTDDGSVTSTTAGAATQTTKAATLDNVCHICGITFTLRSNLMYHLKRHLNYRTHACSICPKRFFNSTALRVHERSHTKHKPFMCELCGCGYVNGSKLNQHMKRHRNQRDFPCSQCGKAFYTAFERDRHMRRHQNLRDKVCPICSKAFVVGSAYYTHMLLHSEVKRYACKPCNLQFSQYSGLYKHRKRYHPNEPAAGKL